jgi:hypothetical protein
MRRCALLCTLALLPAAACAACARLLTAAQARAYVLTSINVIIVTLRSR